MRKQRTDAAFKKSIMSTPQTVGDEMGVKKTTSLLKTTQDGCCAILSF